MNPFVNPKKRSISLPSCCKDLVDVLRSAKPRHTKPKGSDPVKTFIRLVLLQSRDRRATELVIGPASGPEVGCTVTERIGGTWHHVTTIPAFFRSDIVGELIRMAAFTGEQFPGVGLLALQFKRKRLMWRIDMETPGSQCVLTPLPE